jgi:hypothetical protein
MINVNNMLKPATQFLSTNAPAIFTAFGAVGVVGTAVLTAKATFEAADILRDARLELAEDYVREHGPLTDADYDAVQVTKVDAFKLVWLNYLPAVTTGAVSITAIVMSHRISSKRAAVLAAAYALNEGKLEEYQEKVKEKFGIKKAGEVDSAINQDQINRISDAGFQWADPTMGKVWIVEAYTGRPFLSTVEDIKQAANKIGAEINREKSARLSEFYDAAKIEHTDASDYLGWNKTEPLELTWDVGTSPDGSIPVHIFKYLNHPVLNPGDASFQ